MALPGYQVGVPNMPQNYQPKPGGFGQIKTPAQMTQPQQPVGMQPMPLPQAQIQQQPAPMPQQQQPQQVAPQQQRQRRRGGGRGGPQGYQQMAQYAQTNQTPLSAYEQQVLGGDYLDMGNPYAQGMADDIGRNFNEQMGLSLSQLASPFAGAGGTMGFSGINTAMRNRALDEGGENLAGSLSNMYGGLYENERGRMNDANQVWSQRQNSMNSLIGSGYGSDQALRGQLGSARIGANAQMYGQELANALGYDRLGADMGFDLERLRQQEVLMNQAAQRDYLSGIGGTLGNYGTQYNYGVPISQGGAIAQGALGGGLQGFGGYLQGREAGLFNPRTG